jgi:lipopolysaccharide export system protein LptA
MRRAPACLGHLGLVLAAGLALAAPAAAQGLVSLGEGEVPIEISADEGIEWHSRDKIYVAIGNARAARGDLQLFGDRLSAFYRDAEGGGTEVYRVEAQGNVRIVSPNESVYGDDGYYDVDRGVAVLTGKDLRLETEEDTITARDSLEYWADEGRAVARGEAVAVRRDKRILADQLTAHFEKNDKGELDLYAVKAKGDVRISTPSEFVRSDSGVYYVEDELAELFGAVKITRGDNQLNGGYAEINLETGVSRLMAAPPGGVAEGQVRGLLVPEKKTSSEGDS